MPVQTRKQKAGTRKQKAGTKKQKTGSRKQKAGTRKQKAGKKSRKFSNKRRGGLLETISTAIVPFGLFGLKKYADKKLRKSKK